VFALLAIWIGALIASRLIHPEAGWVAFFAGFALRGIDYEAANARPYAMGMFVAAASFYFLIRFLDTRKLWDAALFIIFAAMLWRVHLIFWPIYLVFAIHAFWRGRWAPVAVVFGIVGVLLIPVAMKAVELNAEASRHVVIEQPGLMNLIHSFHLPLVLGVGVGAWVWAKLSPDKAGQDLPHLGLILAWWLVHPIALFAFSRITGNSVFVPRYLAIALPGAAMAATLAAGWFLPARFWKQAALLMGCAALIVSNDWKNLWPPHHNSDWRAAAEAVNKLDLPESTPVICPSPFVEARSPAWTPDYHLPGFLYAQLEVYPVRGKILLFPFATSPEAENYATELAKATLQASNRFVIYGANGGAHFWRDWFARQPALARWKNRSLGDFKDVDVVLFEKL
jgi:hypothetical protein